VEHIARHIARIQQKYTQRGGRRPFGLSTLIAGFERDGTAKLYQTIPSGIYSSWKACAIGRNSKTLREFLERHYNEETSTENGCIKLCLRALNEVVESGAKSMEVGVMRFNQSLSVLEEGVVGPIVASMEAEAEAESLRLKGEAEAFAIEAKAKAEAEQMAKKANAYKEYESAAKVDMVLDTLPKIAAEVAAPLAQCNKVVMISNGTGDVGAGKLTGEVLDIITKVHMTVSQLTGGTPIANVSGPNNHRSSLIA